MKVIYIHIHVRPFSILLWWDWSWPAKKCGLRRLADYIFLREELSVINNREIFCWLLFFFGIGTMVWQHTLELLTQSPITPTPQVNQELPCWHNFEEEEGCKAGQEEDWGGDFCHSEGQRYRWEDQDKDEEGSGWILIFSTHRFRPRLLSLLVVSACLLHGVHMVNSRKGLVRNSHTHIDNFVPLIRLSTL